MSAGNKSSKPMLFSEIIAHPERGLGKVFAKLREQERILSLVKSVIPANLSEHCLGCARKGKILIVFTGSSVWASQVRLHGNTIIEKIGQSMPSMAVDRILPRVLLDGSVRREMKRAPKMPSTIAIERLRSSANSLDEGELKDGLLRLANMLGSRKHT